MKKHKICKILLVILAIFLCVAFYELLGICVAYKKQPEVSNTTKKETKNGSWNECSENTERAVIIEKNPEALLQRVRLIKNAKKEIILSTFAFQSDESGKLILGALHDAADRGVHIRLLVDGMESWIDMEGNPYFYGLSSHENVEIKLYNKANPLKPWKMMGRMHDKYLIADGKRYILGGRNTYNYFLGDFPGHKNYDRDVLVVCDEPEKENSVNQLSEYFETIWNQEDSGYFHNNKKLANRKSVKNAVLELQNSYQKYFEENKERICQTNYTDETFETEKITLVSNPIHTGSKEPVVWYQLGELMKNAKNRVKIHTPYIICNDMMYNTWEEIAENVSDFSIMTNSVANNGNPFGAADYAKNRNRILSTGINIWEYEGGYSYHGKSILIDDDLSVIGSFNMDMRSAYLDTELMLVIRSKDINKQLEEGMMEYEKVSRQILEGGTYNDPYHVEPIELTKKRQKNIFGTASAWMGKVSVLIRRKENVFQILIVEDDKELSQLFQKVLEKNGYQVKSASDGAQALEVLDKEYIDLIISDIMMPVMDGYELVSELRSAGYQIPVLMITAKGSFDDMRQGFLSGSDDYMVKPVNVNEMVLRVGALLRRAQILNEHKIVIGSTEFDYDAMTVTTDKESLVLPKKEFLLLYKLAASPGRTFTKQQLMDEVWGYETEADPHTIEVHIGRIRERFKDNPDFEIVTMRGIGYKVVKK